MSRLYRAIGVMSGTSMDAIDVAQLTTDGHVVVDTGPARAYTYPDAVAVDLHRLLQAPHVAETDPLADLEAAVTDAHVAAVRRFLEDTATDPASIDVVGFHGQTVWHNPAARFTRQLLFGDRAAAALAIPVVNRFRHADVAAGGQGAPLVPVFHRALASAAAQPLMILNLGGVANVTYLDGDAIIAFDTGPASALIDDWMRLRTGQAFDDGGRLAASGKIDAAVLAAMLADRYFALPPPKSLDRQAFQRFSALVEPLGDPDGAATLTAFTIETVAAAVRHVPAAPLRWLVTGGGRHNGAIMEGLARRLGVPVEAVESVGWDGDFLEAQCFAFLAVRSIRALPLSLPTTTGVPHALSGGDLHHPAIVPGASPKTPPHTGEGENGTDGTATASRG